VCVLIMSKETYIYGKRPSKETYIQDTKQPPCTLGTCGVCRHNVKRNLCLQKRLAKETYTKCQTLVTVSTENAVTRNFTRSTLSYISFAKETYKRYISFIKETYKRYISYRLSLIFSGNCNSELHQIDSLLYL